MITLAYSAECIGNGHEPCDWTADGPKADLAARKHTDAERHVTTTHGRPTEPVNAGSYRRGGGHDS